MTTADAARPDLAEATETYIRMVLLGTGALTLDQVNRHAPELARGVAAPYVAELERAAGQTVIEGTTVWSRSQHPRADRCPCCDGPHVFAYGVQDDAGEHVDLMMPVWHAVRSAPEGARVRVTLTVLDA